MTKDTVVRYFRDIPEIITPRLILRKLKKTDCYDMYEYAKDEAVTQYLTWDAHKSTRHTQRNLSYIISRYRTGEYFDWAVVWKETQKMIGTCGFTSFHFGNNSAEIGYVLNRGYWGRGIAPEMIAPILHIAFSDFGLHRVEARYMIENVRSRRVMEKCGMTFEGAHRDLMYVKNRYVTVGVCSILASEYMTKNNSAKLHLND